MYKLLSQIFDGLFLEGSDTYQTFTKRIASVVLPLIILYLKYFDPNDPSRPMPKCPIKALTGYDCPSCGGLRCANAFLNLKFKKALDFNLYLCIVVPILLLFYLVKYLSQNKQRFSRWERYLHCFIAIIGIFWMVYRNIRVNDQQ